MFLVPGSLGATGATRHDGTRYSRLPDLMYLTDPY